MRHTYEEGAIFSAYIGDLEIPDGEYETLGGFLLEVLGRIPVIGDEYRLGEIQMSISRMRGMRVGRVRITIPTESLVQNDDLNN